MCQSTERQGLTLVESAVAMAVIGLVLTLALGAAAAETDSARRQTDMVRAAALAPDLLNRARLASGPEFAALVGGVTGRLEPPLDRYAYEIRVEPVPAMRGLYETRLRMNWSGSSLEVRTRFRRSTSEAAR